MWSTGYKQAWYKKAVRSVDATPMILSDDDAGRGCPFAIDVWARDVLDLYDQCMGLPGGDFSTLLILSSSGMPGPRMLDSQPAPTINENRRQP